MSKRLSPRERRLAFAVVGCALLYGIYQWGLTPLFSNYNQLKSQIAASEAQLLKSLKITHQADQINEEYNRLAPTHQFQGTDEEMISTLLRSLEAIARKAGVTVTEMKPRPGKDQQTHHARYLIEMDAEATAETVFKFLQEVETDPGLFRVLKMTLSPKSRDSSDLRATLLISRTVWI
jgi:hypothetical protein